MTLVAVDKYLHSGTLTAISATLLAPQTAQPARYRNGWYVYVVKGIMWWPGDVGGQVVYGHDKVAWRGGFISEGRGWPTRNGSVGVSNDGCRTPAMTTVRKLQ